MDRSGQLSAMLSGPEGETDFLGELQFAFLTLLLGQVHPRSP